MTETPPISLPARIGKPATRALAQQGITHLQQLTRHRETEVLNWHGIGPKALQELRAALAVHGLTFLE